MSNSVYSNLNTLNCPPSILAVNKTKHCNNKKYIFNLVHQNIQGMLGKELEIELFVNCNDIDLLCITEHWLKKHEFMCGFDNHQVASSFNRENAIRGGSLILVKNSFKYKERVDIVGLSVERTIEIACIELEQLIVMSVYRPPASSYDVFEKKMDEALFKLGKSNKGIVICGDFNINLLEECSLCSRLKSLFLCYNIVNLFLEPTRITSTSSTCIDNIFSNLTPTNKLVINKLGSDHSGQLASFEIQAERKQKRVIKCVPVSDARLNRYRNNVLEKISHLPYTENPNELYNSLFNLAKTECDVVFKTKNIQINDKIVFSDWATVGIHKSREKLYELYEERTFNKSEVFSDYVKLYSKTFKRICAIAKSNYINNKIKSSTNVTKSTWQVINSETGKNKAAARNDFKLKINNQTVTSNQDVAKAFENFFTGIPVSTTKALHSSPTVAESLLKLNVDDCKTVFQFSHVNDLHIIKAFKSLEMKKTTDLHGLSVKVISSIIDCIAPNLACIFNKCIDSGVFPDLMKHSKVIPLFKVGNTSDPTNYRPISILPTLSKIFEKIILNQLQGHFNRNNLMHLKQFGFTKGRSTTDAGVELIHEVFAAWEEFRDAIGVFCDLSKAFDCVHHDILIRKLNHYGVKGHALDLLESYLVDRIQRVDVNGQRSLGSKISMGVPQGSILGPFLFLVYINDLPHLVKEKHGLVLFADDTSLMFKVSRKQSANDDVNNAISEVVNWFTINNLLLNEKKTKCVRFELPNVKSVPTNVLIKGEKLDLVESTKFLGITLDTKLQWGPHITKLSHKLSSAAYAVKKIRALTDVDTARLVYFSYFHSLMSYGILLWGHAADALNVFILQKRAVRAIYKLKPRMSLREKFKEINILTFVCQYIYDNLVYVRKNIANFEKNCDRHNINTRNKEKLVTHTSRLHRITHSFEGNCIRFYNKVPIDIQNLPLDKFKATIKQKLYKKGYYRICDYLEEDAPWE